MWKEGFYEEIIFKMKPMEKQEVAKQSRKERKGRNISERRNRM